MYNFCFFCGKEQKIVKKNSKIFYVNVEFVEPGNEFLFYDQNPQTLHLNRILNQILTFTFFRF